MNLDKMMKGSNQTFGIILLVGVVILTVILMNYNQSKSSHHEKMTVSPMDSSGILQSVPTIYPTGSIESASSLLNTNLLNVSGIESPPVQASQSSMNPSDLLPRNQNTEWSNLNPASGDLKNLNLLSADQMIGINTVSSSLRNANYQERSDPAIPKVDLGPWWHSTIEPDTHRRPLEVGNI
jgi:hypothetical protein